MSIIEGSEVYVLPTDDIAEVVFVDLPYVRVQSLVDGAVYWCQRGALVPFHPAVGLREPVWRAFSTEE